MTSRLLDSPVGRLLLTAEAGALIRIGWAHEAAGCGPDPVLDAAVAQLEEYFAGRRRDFDLPLRPRGTDFRIRTWRELQRIPHGKTATYGDIADALGSSARAVGGACGANPLPLRLRRQSAAARHPLPPRRRPQRRRRLFRRRRRRHQAPPPGN